MTNGRLIPYLLVPALAACGHGSQYAATASAEVAGDAYYEPAGGEAGGAPAVVTATAAPSPSPSAPIAQPEGVEGERYSNTPENRWVDARRDAMSTLSLDVDTASYTLMRRNLTAGVLPRPESVRVEEWINFFRYGDAPAAPGGDPFAVHLESAPSPFGEDLNLLRVAVQASEVPAAERPPANLVFLVDVSGSMHGADRLGLVQQSLRILVESLAPTDTVSIVVYAGSDAVLLSPTPIAERGRILEVVDRFSAGGSTHGAAGIRTAYELAARSFRPGGINRVILCTDGDFNVGATGDALVQLVESQRQRGITLTVLGFGTGNFNDRDLERIAGRGSGNYAFIDSRNEALRVLSRELAGTLQVIAEDVKVQVRFDEHVVRRFRLVGYENRVLQHRDFTDDTVDAVEVGSGDSVTAFFEYELVPGVDLRRHRGPLAEVRVRFKPPGGGASSERAFSIEAGAVRAQVADASSAFRFGAAVAELAEILRGSEHSTGARFDEVIALARGAGYSSADAAELVSLAARAAELHREAAPLQAAR